MGAEPKPRAKRGDRNVFCKNYNECLDHAIDQSWLSWNCERCELFSSKPEDFDMDFMVTKEDPIYYDSSSLDLDNILMQYQK